MIPMLHAPALDAVSHSFFGRGSARDREDDPQGADNRSSAGAMLIARAPIAINHQVHGIFCRTITPGFDPDARPQADALATASPGIILGIHTADCAPVLLADAQAGVIGAAHAGWRGALYGVTDSTIAAMEALGADRSRIAAAVGPCIAKASYEVDADFAARFCNTDRENARFFSDGQRDGHPHFDLEAYVGHRLAAAGIAQITLLGVDTCRSDQHWSHRRGTLSGTPELGRQISLIGLPHTESIS
jgi:polyphenol oxidase